MSHRALIFNAMATGRSLVTGLLDAGDVRRTQRCLMQLGANIDGGVIHGRSGVLRAPSSVLDCGNSGTTARLLLGVLAGQPFEARLTGDESLRGRPMARVTEPLATMGARFECTEGRLPIAVDGSRLEGGAFRLRVASAQVKTALLLAGLRAEGEIRIVEPRLSRDHSEIMLAAMGAKINRERTPTGEHIVTMMGSQSLNAHDFEVPGDISSAAFFIVAATIIPGSDIRIQGVGLNPTRTGLLDVLSRMGADVTVIDERVSGGERVGTLRVRHADLVGTTVDGADIPRMIDEVPILGVAAAFATGQTIVRDAAELRVKESDRCAQTVSLVRSMGFGCEELADGFIVDGNPNGRTNAFTHNAGLDHRMAMSAVVAGLRSQAGVTVKGVNSIRTSFPTFMATLESLYG